MRQPDPFTEPGFLVNERVRKALILTGLSGSGKSTFAKQFCLTNPNYLRINRDEIRRSLLPVSLPEYWQTWTEEARSRVESLVNDSQKALVASALARGWNLLIDNTNLKLSYLNEFRKLLSSHTDALELSYKLIDTPLNVCIQRDQLRADSVGANVIRKQAEQLTVLKKNFRFVTETLTRSSAFQRQQNEALPRCVLVDIDGTVAEKGNRSPFDWERVGEDQPRWPVIRLVQALKAAGYMVIFFSGRDAVCRLQTLAWLSRYMNWPISELQLFMRPERDNRKDSIIKQELFERHIVGNFFVELVVDDRQQVVDMWRRTLGLTCIQVDYGDF